VGNRIPVFLIHQWSILYAYALRYDVGVTYYPTENLHYTAMPHEVSRKASSLAIEGIHFAAGYYFHTNDLPVIHSFSTNIDLAFHILSIKKNRRCKFA
jgi:hypothetical protein